MNQNNTKLHKKAEQKCHCEEPQATKQSRSNAFERRGFARGDCFAPLAMTVLNNNAELHKEVAVQLLLIFGRKDDTVVTRQGQSKDAYFSNPPSAFRNPQSKIQNPLSVLSACPAIALATAGASVVKFPENLSQLGVAG